MISRLLALGLTAVALWLAAPASAATTTIGSIAPPGLSGGCGNCDGIQAATAPFPSSPSYAVPSGGWTITTWRAMGGATSSGELALHIYRPTGVADQWTLIARTGLETFPEDVPTAHSASIPVQGGDVLGITTGPNAIDGTPHLYPGVAGDEVKGLPGITPAIGGVYGPGGLSSSPETRLNVEATLTSVDPVPPAATPTTKTKKKCKKGRKLKKIKKKGKPAKRKCVKAKKKKK